MDAKEQAHKLTDEVLTLEKQFASKFFANINAMNFTIESLTQLHIEQNCKECCFENGGSNFSKSLSEMDQSSLGIEYNNLSDTMNARKSVRKSIRKSRKSVCVLPKFVLSSSDDDSDCDDDDDGDDDNCKNIDDSNAGNDASVFSSSDCSDGATVHGSESNAQTQLNLITEINGESEDLNFGKNHNKSGADLQTVQSDTHSDSSDEGVNESLHNEAKNRYRQIVYSSDETESDSDINESRKEVEEDLSNNDNKTSSDRKSICNNTHIVEDNLDSPVLLDGSVSKMIVEETPFRNDLKNGSQENKIGDQTKSYECQDSPDMDESAGKPADSSTSGEDSIAGKSTALESESDESDCNFNARSRKITSLTVLSNDETSDESETDEENHGDKTKRKISYNISDTDDTPIKSVKEKQNTESNHQTMQSKPLTVISSDEDDFDNFVSTIKPVKKSVNLIDENDMSDFIVSDDSVDDDENNESLNAVNQGYVTPKPLLALQHMSLLSSDDDEVTFHSKTPKTNTTKKAKTFRTPATSGRNVFGSIKTPRSEYGTPAYKREFNKLKESSLQEYFEIFNKTVFDNALPADLKVSWNPRMRKTAGFCYSSSSAFGKREARIELSNKVVDSIERLRDTLIHELCHAATWVLDGKKNAGHGPVWKQWAKKANKIHPALPIITTCHQYEIQTKYKYQCNGCSHVFGRHSKSINAEKHRCGKCGGIPELMEEPAKTPKAPNAFAQFMKTNFASTKKANPTMSHKELMQLISQKFSENKENKENE